MIWLAVGFALLVALSAGYLAWEVGRAVEPPRLDEARAAEDLYPGSAAREADRRWRP